MRFRYQQWSIKDPAFPHERFLWQPVVQVQLSDPTQRHPMKSRRFEAFIDSGAVRCFFDASIGRAIGLNVQGGLKGQLGGIVSATRCDVFYHDVNLHIAGEVGRIAAGFAEGLDVAGVLGRRGFFDQFIVTFDHSVTPPEIELTRIARP